MENIGHIDAPFQLRGGRRYKFEVSPDHGILKPGERIPVTFVFEPDFVGEFEESFAWALQVRRRFSSFVAYSYCFLGGKLAVELCAHVSLCGCLMSDG